MKKNIYLVTVSMPLGGKESFIIELANHISNSVHNVNIVPIDGFLSKTLESELSKDVNVIRLPFKSKILNRIYTLIRLNLSSLQKGNFIHLNDGILEKYIYFRRAKLITYIHGFFDDLFDSSIPKVFANKTVEEFYNTRFPFDKSKIKIPMLVTPKLVLKHESNNNFEHLRLCLPGRIHTLKGQINFIENFQDIFNEKIRLHLIGDIEEENNTFKEMIDSNNFISHEIFIARNEYLRNLQNFDIIISSSHSETFGIAIVEGILMGLYPILPKIPVYEELIRNLGYGSLYNQWDRSEFLDGIDDFLKSGIDHNLLDIFREDLEKKSPLSLYED